MAIILTFRNITKFAEVVNKVTKFVEGINNVKKCVDVNNVTKLVQFVWKKLFLKKIGRTKCQTDIRFRRTIFTLGRTMSNVRPLF